MLIVITNNFLGKPHEAVDYKRNVGKNIITVSILTNKAIKRKYKISRATDNLSCWKHMAVVFTHMQGYSKLRAI